MFASKSFNHSQIYPVETMQTIKELERKVTELEQRNKQNYDCLIELNYDYSVLSQQFNSLPDNIKKSHFCVDEKLELKTRLSKVDLIIDSEADKNRISELEKKLQKVQSELEKEKISVTREERTEFGNSSPKVKLLEEELRKVKDNSENEKMCLLNSIAELEKCLKEAQMKKESESNLNLSRNFISESEKTQLLSKIATYEKQIKQCVDVKLYETAKSQIVSLKEACLK